MSSLNAPTEAGGRPNDRCPRAAPVKVEAIGDFTPTDAATEALARWLLELVEAEGRR